QSVAGPLIAMNTMLADSLEWIATELEEALSNGSQEKAVVVVLQKLMQEHGNAVFGGDGYSSDWHKEAVEERGLKNIPTTADALPVLNEDYIKDLFTSTGVLSEVELASRYEVYSEQYILSIELEAKLMIDMAKTSIYPAATRYLGDLSSAIMVAKDTGVDLSTATVEKVGELISAMMESVDGLGDALAQHDFDSTDAHMQHCAGAICGLMDDVRAAADALELEVADDMWPLPKYQEMLFIK
ncbi:MAG: glutamine synthetase type III, partial [Cocleimonas sp.]|nr:glutamine synthetase type III [Cocleimonas sp.]